MKTKEQIVNEKRQRKHDAAFIAILLCILATPPILCWGDGITQGYSLFEQIRGVVSFLVVAGIGYIIGYFLPIRKWMNKEEKGK